MKIAIYHDLEIGGALESLIKFCVVAKSEGHTIDIYCHKNNITKHCYHKISIFPTCQPKNIFKQLVYTLTKYRIIQKQIAEIIDKNNYDLTIVFPSLYTQSPFILKYLNSRVFYVFTETKREFYEETSFDYWSPRRLISRIIRYPIKIIDYVNCRSSATIISNSYYTSNLLKKIYGKYSFVIYPGMKFIVPTKFKVQPSLDFFSVGQLSKIKGHNFSLKQLSGVANTLNILGRETYETATIVSLSLQETVKIRVIHSESNKTKNNYFLKHKIFLANQQGEPFGIATIEAADKNKLLLGKNDGGTAEIIRNGVNGYLYPVNTEVAKKITQEVLNKKHLTLYKVNKILWKEMYYKIMYLYINS